MMNYGPGVSPVQLAMREAQPTPFLSDLKSLPTSPQVFSPPASPQSCLMKEKGSNSSADQS